MRREQIIELIQTERERQDKLHPRWHGDQHGLVVLAEEFGEVAKALYELTHAPSLSQSMSYEHFKANQESIEIDLEDEIIQVAAVCVRWLENRR